MKILFFFSLNIGVITSTPRRDIKKLAIIKKRHGNWIIANGVVCSKNQGNKFVEMNKLTSVQITTCL
ncbi:hypothetical protein PPA04_16280 [Pediococcus parvulus]|nr:hypothetical protein PPA04_16280 [Pediococcus parvulus]GHC07891.1 hypothetical protein GCM10008912_09360 [Pediococcus parvulus]